MRHPLRAVTPPVKSQHINSTRRSQITTTQEPRNCKILPATPHSYIRSSHTFITPFTQCTNHGNMFPTPCQESTFIPPGQPRHSMGHEEGRDLSDAACSFGRRHVPGFPEPENNNHPWLQESSFFLHASHTVSRAFGEGRGSSSFRPRSLTVPRL